MGLGFSAPVDICNRGLQHVGARRIDSALAFTEVSVQAGECAFVYDKLRRAELRRNVWRFATRLALLRPLTQTSRIISPSLWASGTTYMQGALVIDATNTIWVSQIPDNVGNTPGNSSAWELYFGPLAVDAYNPQITYYAGDLVYVTQGEGSPLVYMSEVTANGISPTLPQSWSASVTYDTDDVVVVFPNWSSGTTYAAGNAVVYTDGNTYVSLVAGNVGNVPSALGTFWALYPQVTYSFSAGVVGAPQIQQAQASSVLEWNATTNYAAGVVVDYQGLQYVSLIPNINFTPLGDPTQWAQITNGTYYQSLTDLNQNFPPVFSPTQWTSTLTAPGKQGPGWTLLSNVVLTAPFLSWPLGSGPVEQSATQNIYRLPAGFLREAPQDPKMGSVSFLGSPSGMQYNDWKYQGDYIMTRWSTPIVYRFVADVSLVTEMDDMFCEGLAARIGMEVCERVTQSDSKVQLCGQIYKGWMSEARMINGIETGSVEPAEDDFVTTRL